MRSLIVRGLIVLGAVAALLAACSPKDMMLPNRAPETTIFVQGTVDTVNHIVHLFWFGSDPDGSVTDFELRMLNPSAPDDTQWVATSRRDEDGALLIQTDSLFTVFTPDGLTEPVFEVRAVDNDGLRDPSPARQAFTFTNLPPSVQFVTPPGLLDTTFASVTLGWDPIDVDGDLAGARFRIWLDGQENDPEFATGTTFTLPTDRFRQGGQLLSGYRTVFIQAIDDGGRAGNTDSTTWFVREPVAGDRARLLIIDDVPTTNPAFRKADSLFLNSATRNLPADEYSVVRMQTTQPFRSSKDVEQTFNLFEAVVWYRSTEVSFSTVLRDFQEGIGAYIDGGGAVFLEGLHLIDNDTDAFGPLSLDFASKYMGTDFFFRRIAGNDSTAGWGNRNGGAFHSTVYQDSMRFFQYQEPGIRAFGVRDSNFVALWAPIGQLAPPNPIPMAVGTRVVQPGGGRLIVLTTPLVAEGPYNFNFNVPRFLAKVYDDLGIID